MILMHEMGDITRIIRYGHELDRSLKSVRLATACQFGRGLCACSSACGNPGLIQL